jgi:soluble P-type ATPase
LTLTHTRYTGAGRRVTPFDAKNRRTEAVVEQNGQRFRVMKGAVRTLAEACGLQPPAIEELEKRVSESALKGYRMLAVARGPETGKPVLVGLMSLYDPPRPDAKQLIATLHDLGVPVKMLTGDALAVACEIGQGVGLPNIRHMADLKADNQAADLFAGADGFAEVFPEDKYTVVKHLQAAGHVTGMTGDGVNDAPALRQAEVGIAVSTATDVAKGAASVVLTQPGLTNIVALVEQGRTIYQRILTWIINKISRTILKAAFVAIAFVITGKFVVSAFAMLLLVFMTDFAKISLATDNVRPSQKPETWNIGGFITVSVVLGIAMVAETLLLLWIGWTHFGLATNNHALYTFSFLMLLYFAVFSVVSARERSWFWATLPSKTFLAALAADALTGTVLTFVGLPGLVPLPLWQTLAIFGYAMIACLLVNDAVKVIMIKWRVPNAVARKPDAKTVSKSEAKPESSPKAKSETATKAESKPADPVAAQAKSASGMQPVVKPIPETEPKPDAGDKPKTDLTPQIATRAYELYERQGRRDGESVQNWDRAEQEIRENQARTEPKSESKSVVKVQLDPEAKPSPIPDTNIKAATGIKPAPEAKAEPQTESQAGVPTKSNTEPKPETKAKPPGDVSPQLIERVHKL